MPLPGQLPENRRRGRGARKAAAIRAQARNSATRVAAFGEEDAPLGKKDDALLLGKKDA